MRSGEMIRRYLFDRNNNRDILGHVRLGKGCAQGLNLHLLLQKLVLQLFCLALNSNHT